jgi:hypothetical protein
MNKFTNIALILIILLLTFFIGLAIVGVIEKGINDIKIEVPKQSVVVEVPKDKDIIESFDNKNADYENIIPKPLNSDIIENEEVLEIYKKPLSEEVERIYNNPFLPADKNINVLTPKQNFPNPSDMSTIELNAFKFGYPNGMTMQDYVNWLYLFKDSQELLTLDHLTNFQKIKGNIPLEYAHGKVPPPAKRVPPINADNYFNNLYQDNQKSFADNLNSTTSSIMGFNYKDYTDFGDNFDVYGKSGKIFNDELGIKTDPKVLQKFIGPNYLKADIKETDV